MKVVKLFMRPVVRAVTLTVLAICYYALLRVLAPSVSEAWATVIIASLYGLAAIAFWAWVQVYKASKAK